MYSAKEGSHAKVYTLSEEMDNIRAANYALKSSMRRQKDDILQAKDEMKQIHKLQGRKKSRKIHRQSISSD